MSDLRQKWSCATAQDHREWDAEIALPTNKSINQSINWSINGPANQASDQTTDGPNDQPIETDDYEVVGNQEEKNRSNDVFWTTLRTTTANGVKNMERP